MRPRLITAENGRPIILPSVYFPRFNEAAAHHRGERRLDEELLGHGLASMRPRLITAENSWTGDRYEQRRVLQ